MRRPFTIYYAKERIGEPPDQPRIYVVTRDRQEIRCHEVLLGPSRIIDKGPQIPEGQSRVILETVSPIRVRIGDEWQELK